MFVLGLLSAENSVFGMVKRMNRYLSVAFFLYGIPALKTVLPTDCNPCLMPPDALVGHSCDCKFNDFSKKYRLRDDIRDSYSWFSHILHTCK